MSNLSIVEVSLDMILIAGIVTWFVKNCLYQILGNDDTDMDSFHDNRNKA